MTTTVLPFPQRPQPRRGTDHSSGLTPADADALIELCRESERLESEASRARDAFCAAIDAARADGVTWVYLAELTELSEGALRQLRSRWRARRAAQSGTTAAAQ